jgi:heptosyltransferase II
VIVPFGSTSADLTGPGLVQADEHKLLSADAACAPCFLRECPVDFRCMRGIAAEQIVNAAADMLFKK